METIRPMEQTWVRILLWLAVIAVCGMIFLFSAQTGDESAETSGKVVDCLIGILVKGFELLSEIRQQEIREIASLMVRKLAHFGEFALLAFLVRLLMRSYRIAGGGLKAWLCATLYAATDELHQVFVSARGPSLTDVGIDSMGAAFGAGLACLILWLCGRRRRSAGTPPA